MPARMLSLALAAVALATAAEPLIKPDTRIHVGYEDAEWSDRYLAMARRTHMPTSVDTMIAAFTAKDIMVALVPERKDADYVFAIAGASQNVSNGYVARTTSGRYTSTTRVHEDVSRKTDMTAKLIDPKNANAVVWSKTYSGGKSEKAACEALAKAFAEWIKTSK